MGNLLSVINFLIHVFIDELKVVVHKMNMNLRYSPYRHVKRIIISNSCSLNEITPIKIQKYVKYHNYNYTYYFAICLFFYKFYNLNDSPKKLQFLNCINSDFIDNPISNKIDCKLKSLLIYKNII